MPRHSCGPATPWGHIRACAYVGDQREVDAVAAVAAGLTGIEVRRPAGRAGSDAEAGPLTTGSLTKLPGALGLVPEGAG